VHVVVAHRTRRSTSNIRIVSNKDRSRSTGRKRKVPFHSGRRRKIVLAWMRLDRMPLLQRRRGQYFFRLLCYVTICSREKILAIRCTSFFLFFGAWYRFLKYDPNSIPHLLRISSNSYTLPVLDWKTIRSQFKPLIA
jgi:hypothetical protein